MSFRTFVDSTGAEWEAFDVVPRSMERRAGERRSSSSGSAPDAEVEAERRDRERRLSVGRGPSSRRVSTGWLVFERGGDRRRLSPIPDNWTRLSDAELSACLGQARAVAEKKERRG